MLTKLVFPGLAEHAAGRAVVARSGSGNHPSSKIASEAATGWAIPSG